ncbi:hypothetical protein RZS08_60830, partial [Arthrospira platensis SPKY1]|nr:hypothetical protein [Arthrospira platensis SPKY1]
QTIVINPVNPIVVCDDNNDGFAIFDLTTVIPALTENNPSLSVSFHETADDAFFGVNAILFPAQYTNIVAQTQTIHIRVSAAGSACFETTTLTLLVRPRPQA